MAELKAINVKQKCSVPYCTNTDTKLISRANEFGTINRVYLCKDCANEIWAIYRNSKYSDIAEVNVIMNSEIKPKATGQRADKRYQKK